jgi:hypothetical protein
MKGSQEEKLFLTRPSLYSFDGQPLTAWNFFSLSANLALPLTCRFCSLALLADLALFLRSSFYLSLSRLQLLLTF